MSNKLKFALIYFLQFIPLIIYPPSTFQGGGLVVILVVIAFISAIGYWLLKGRTWALKMSIFLHGFNVIIRLMMGISHAVRPDNLGGGVDTIMIITSLAGILISGWFLLRLDRPDIRSTMVA